MTDSLPRRVVFFGDSRADWWHVPVVPGFQCIAVGVPGASALYLARCFQGMVGPLRPGIVVVQMGVNDLTGLHQGSCEVGSTVATTRDAIAAVAASVCNLWAYVIVTTIFPVARGYLPAEAVQAAIKLVNDQLRALAGPGVEVFDSTAVLTGSDGYVLPAFADDDLHLSPTGYEALNKALIPILEAVP